jgi:hypothetical protein
MHKYRYFIFIKIAPKMNQKLKNEELNRLNVDEFKNAKKQTLTAPLSAFNPNQYSAEARLFSCGKGTRGIC